MTVFTKVKAEQFKCTDERANTGGLWVKPLQGSANTVQCQVRLGLVRLGLVSLGLVRLGLVRFGLVRLG